MGNGAAKNVPLGGMVTIPMRLYRDQGEAKGGMVGCCGKISRSSGSGVRRVWLELQGASITTHGQIKAHDCLAFFPGLESPHSAALGPSRPQLFAVTMLSQGTLCTACVTTLSWECIASPAAQQRYQRWEERRRISI